MTDTTKLGPWVRRFLLEHLVDERNLARNTQRSYRDSLALLISFIATKVRKEVDQLIVGDITAERLRLFLQDLEQTRGCSVSTRNQRLRWSMRWARSIAEHSPEHIEWCGAIRTIPFKKAMKREITYLEKAEMDALLAAPDRRTPQGPTRLRAAALPLQHWRARRRGRATENQKPRTGPSANASAQFSTDPRQRQQAAPLSPVAAHGERADRHGRWQTYG
jgi:integrase